MANEIHLISLIREIKARPILYEASKRDSLSYNEKNKAWLEIFRTLIPKWDTFSDEIKDEEEKIIKTKWRNLRDYCMKSYRKGRTEFQNSNELEFLRAVYEKREMRNNMKTYLKRCYKVETKTDIESSSSQLFDDFPVSDSETTTVYLPEGTSEDLDDLESFPEEYDKMFLLSLMPSLRKLPGSTKLKVKIKIQQILSEALKSVS